MDNLDSHWLLSPTSIHSIWIHEKMIMINIFKNNHCNNIKNPTNHELNLIHVNSWLGESPVNSLGFTTMLHVDKRGALIIKE